MQTLNQPPSISASRLRAASDPLASLRWLCEQVPRRYHEEVQSPSLSLFETDFPDLKRAAGVDTRDIAVPALANTVAVSNDYITKSWQMDEQSYREVEHAYVDDNGFNESTFTFYQ